MCEIYGVSPEDRRAARREVERDVLKILEDPKTTTTTTPAPKPELVGHRAMFWPARKFEPPMDPNDPAVKNNRLSYDAILRCMTHVKDWENEDWARRLQADPSFMDDPEPLVEYSADGSRLVANRAFTRAMRRHSHVRFTDGPFAGRTMSEISHLLEEEA